MSYEESNSDTGFEDEITAVSATPDEVEQKEAQEAVELPAPQRSDLVGRAFGEVAVSLFGISASTIGGALDVQLEQGQRRIGEILVDQKVLSKDQVQTALAAQLDLPLLNTIDHELIPDDFVQAIPLTFARTHHLVALGADGEGRIILACMDPLETDVLDDLRVLLRAEFVLALAPQKVISDTINRLLERASRSVSFDDEDIDDIGGEVEDEIVDINVMLAKGDEDAFIIRWVNWALSSAVRDRASDIHIEPFENELVMRYRIDGVLKEIQRMPKRVKEPVTARIKIMAELDIAEKRLPQDGRIRLKVAGKDIDVRVSSVPTAYGERIVMRLLDRSSVLKDLSEIGMDGRTLVGMHALIKKSHGIILVTGPTGSGKTTTLYGSLSKINRPDLNILTIEDPVEYQLPGVGQVQVNAKIDLTFSSGLRSFLRQDPDVIMVGEIRDRETAEIAIQASLTGHLVLSTVHTNDSAGAITRLVEIGVEPFLVASSLIGVLAQRLVRTICTDCKEGYVPSKFELDSLNLDPTKVKTLYKGKGCPACQGTGYRGRVGIYELLLVDDELRSLIPKNVDAGQLKKAGIRNGMVPLREDGADKVLKGITTIEEVNRVTQEDSESLEAVS
ncbi:MAG: type II secretion system ATPase GspE [Deltaproteobacteria bacterium]|nr:type II secretion system ATPase GspE [Deltaproteobacteria bacterium]